MKTASKAVIAGVATIATVSALIKWYKRRNGQQSVTDACKSSVVVGNRPVYVVHTCEQFETLVKEYDLMNETIMGFDAEWTNKCPLSIIQLTFSKVNIIIQVQRLDVLPPPSLNELMKKQELLKTGVGIREDIVKILKYMVIDEVNGVVDITDTARLVGHTDLKTSLQFLAEKYMHVTLNKDPKIRCGNWDEINLSYDQIHYGASDGYYSRELFVVFYDMYNKSTENPFSPLEWVISKGIERSVSDINPPSTLRVLVKDSNGDYYRNFRPQELSRYTAFESRKTPVYEDCHLYAPDGDLLCRSSRRKLEWYVNKGLGDVVCENPYSVRLRFEPKGKPKKESLNVADNICVVCGKNSNYVSHSILPPRYRHCLPEQWKSHNNFDNVVLCIPCSIRCNKYDDIFSRKVLQSHGLAHNCTSVIVNNEVLAAKKAANILYRIYKGEITPPLKRKLEVERSVLEFLQKYNCFLWKENMMDGNTATTEEEQEEQPEEQEEQLEENDEKKKEEDTSEIVIEDSEEREQENNPSFSPKQLSRKQRKEAKKARKHIKKNKRSETGTMTKKKVKKNQVHYDILSEEEYLKRERNPYYGEEDDGNEECPLPSEEVLQAITVPANPYAAFELNEEEGVQNFDTALLMKMVNLNAFSIDESYLPPEEIVMKKILSQENPHIAATEFVMMWRKNFMETMKPKFMKAGWRIEEEFPPLRE